MATLEVQKKLDTLSYQLDNVPGKMRIFSSSMKRLSMNNTIGTCSSTAQRFQKLRDDTRNDAIVYVQGALPVVKQCVSNIKRYFKYYQDSTMAEWWKSIADIIEETKEHKEACNALVVIHQDILTEFKKREDVAKSLMTEMRELSAEYEKEAKELQKSATAKSVWAIGLAFVPIANMIASPILGASAASDVGEAVAKKEEADIQIAATVAVRDTLIPALSQFVEGLEHIAGFFEVIHEELKAFRNKGKRAKDAEEPQRMHYNTMKGKAGRIMGGCNRFLEVLPAISSDLEAIPAEGTNQNYVDKWLESHMKMMEMITKAIGKGSN